MSMTAELDFTGNLSTSIGWYPIDWFSAELFSSFSVFLTNSKRVSSSW